MDPLAGPPMLPPRYIPLRFDRPVNPQWKCQKSGDCCRIPKELVMTKEEASALTMHAPSTITLQFRPVEDNFVSMKAGPCPLFVFHTCLVYEHRPYSCRRFGCMRPDTNAEPFEPSGANMRDRTETNRKARKLAIRMQAKAMPWAKKHGWVED